ncbi:MAG: DoxX family protein [Nitrosopumilus sp. H8]|nr:MAG: DoxX family protein [Nitrosopumilus sp. H8]
MGTAEIRESIFNGTAMLGIRLTLGAIFIAHGIPKFNAGFAGFLEGNSIPLAMQYPIAAGELIPGILLVVGILSRMSGAVIAAIMIGAIFAIHGTTALIGDAGIEFELMLLATSLMVMVAGPGRLSVARFAGKLPRWLH